MDQHVTPLRPQKSYNHLESLLKESSIAKHLLRFRIDANTSPEEIVTRFRNHQRRETSHRYSESSTDGLHDEAPLPTKRQSCDICNDVVDESKSLRSQSCASLSFGNRNSPLRSSCGKFKIPTFDEFKKSQNSLSMSADNSNLQDIMGVLGDNAILRTSSDITDKVDEFRRRLRACRERESVRRPRSNSIGNESSLTDLSRSFMPSRCEKPEGSAKTLRTDVTSQRASMIDRTVSLDVTTQCDTNSTCRRFFSPRCNSSPDLHKQAEALKVVGEFHTSELTYHRDLTNMYNELYIPLRNTKLLNSSEIEAIFCNVGVLLTVSDKLEKRFDDVRRGVSAQCLGECFIENSNDLFAFETYCINHSRSCILLESLERERELLRIFLLESQNENTKLRRMHLKSFLIMPVQRIMKYPLLLGRLLDNMDETDRHRSCITQAKETVEDILDHINEKSIEGLSRKKSRQRSSRRRGLSRDGVVIQELAVRFIGWVRDETRILKMGNLCVIQKSDTGSVRTSKANCQTGFVKQAASLAVLAVNNPMVDSGAANLSIQSTHSYGSRDQFVFPRCDATGCVVVLLREKSPAGEFSQVCPLLNLREAIVSVESNYFALQFVDGEIVFLCGDSPQETLDWYRICLYYSLHSARWKVRRNALAHVILDDIV